jgi:thymidylate synthase
MNNVDKEYFRLLNTILTNGRRKHNRTGIDTIGVFGEQAKFDIDLDAFPILTTKKVFFKAILHELLWFIKGDTNIKYLVDNDVHIWDEWAFKRYIDKNGAEVINTQDEFIQKIKEDDDFAEKWGELGEGTYGGMWRGFPFAQLENPSDEDHNVVFRRVDQLQKVIDKLKSNPDDRRMIISAWHPYWIDHCALPPCHCLFHFNTEELTLDERFSIFSKGWNLEKAKLEWEKEGFTDYHHLLDEHCIPRRRLNCLLYQRSCDAGLGIPFNISSYCLLTALVAHSVNMESGVFTHTYGDLHIYENHIEQLKLQLTREPMKLPKLWINPKVRDLFSFKYDDIRLVDYVSHPTIKMDVAV